jgi:GNAT superfamily N-acetyltransferase
MSAVTVRRATLEDAQIVAELAQKLVQQHTDYNPRRFMPPAAYEQVTRFYGSQTKVRNAAVLVAEFDKKIIGFAFVQFEVKNYSDLLESAAWLHDIYVDEAARRLDAGEKLIEMAVETAKEFGANKLMLTVAAENEVAQVFFKHIGFRTTMVEMMLDLTEEKGND